MKKLSHKHWALIITGIVIVVVYLGWQAYDVYTTYNEMNEFVTDSGAYMNEVVNLWNEYGSKPVSYYEEFSRACDSLLDAYASYTNYPYYIPIENNPSVSDIILSTNPLSIKVVSGSRIRVNLGQFPDEEEMGFLMTWERGPGGSGDLYVGTGSQNSDPVYTR